MKKLFLSILICIGAIAYVYADTSAGNGNVIPAAGNTDGYYELGMSLYEQGDYKEALKQFGMSAKEGNHDAQYQIGLMFLEGKGVNANPADAAYWFRKAAQNGHAASQFEIGYCFANGVGVQPDERIAAEWFWRAAEQGDPDAAFYLARMYRDGKGMNANIEKARKYYEIAAKAGLPEATDELNQLPAPKATSNLASRKSARKGRKR
ncbi:MAG: sel1 repeat family protein [Muribaculaceae bacterium]|nr:sel1 repeat family protein [Muribaculaceae bacterium]